MPEKIECPLCKHKLLYLNSGGLDISIKCMRCKRVVTVKRTPKEKE